MKKRKMGYLKKKKARKSVAGAWFSRCLAQKQPGMLLPSELENQGEAVHCGWQDQGGFGTTGCHNTVSHQMNQTLQHRSTTFPIHAREELLSYPHCRAKGNNCLLLKAQNHKRFLFFFFFLRVDAETVPDGTLLCSSHRCTAPRGRGARGTATRKAL